MCEPARSCRQKGSAHRDILSIYQHGGVEGIQRDVVMGCVLLKQFYEGCCVHGARPRGAMVCLERVWGA
jgi:hypothetical protein